MIRKKPPANQNSKWVDAAQHVAAGQVSLSKLKVQFGPTPEKPGSRLIDKKRKAPR